MGAALWINSCCVISRFPAVSTMSRLLVVFVQLALGAAVYVLLALLLRLREAHQAVSMLRSMIETAKANVRG